MALTDHDRKIIAQAREIAGLRFAQAFCERAGVDDSDMARAVTLGEAQVYLDELAALAERLGGDGA